MGDVSEKTFDVGAKVIVTQRRGGKETQIPGVYVGKTGGQKGHWLEVNTGNRSLKARPANVRAA